MDAPQRLGRAQSLQADGARRHRLERASGRPEGAAPGVPRRHDLARRMPSAIKGALDHATSMRCVATMAHEQATTTAPRKRPPPTSSVAAPRTSGCPGALPRRRRKTKHRRPATARSGAPVAAGVAHPLPNPSRFMWTHGHQRRERSDPFSLSVSRRWLAKSRTAGRFAKPRSKGSKPSALRRTAPHHKLRSRSEPHVGPRRRRRRGIPPSARSAVTPHACGPSGSDWLSRLPSAWQATRALRRCLCARNAARSRAVGECSSRYCDRDYAPYCDHQVCSVRRATSSVAYAQIHRRAPRASRIVGVQSGHGIHQPVTPGRISGVLRIAYPQGWIPRCKVLRSRRKSSMTYTASGETS